MPSDLQITNIKDQANANSAITIASDGQITVNQNNPTLTLGSNATFLDGTIVNQTIIKYALGSNFDLPHASTSVKIVTRKTSTDTAVESISVNANHTYIYEYTGFVQSFGGSTIQRNINVYLYDDNTSRTWGGTDVNNQIARITTGRERNETDGNSNATSGAFHITGASHYNSDDTRYIYLATASSSSSNTVNLIQSAAFPLFLKITKIKGELFTTRN